MISMGGFRALAGEAALLLALCTAACVPAARAAASPATLTVLRQIVLADGSTLLDLSPDGTMQAVADHNNLCVYATVPWRRLRCAAEPKGGLALQGTAWSPDGTHIAFTDDFVSTLHSDIHVLDVRTGKQINLSIGKGTSRGQDDTKAPIDLVPTWSPDSKWIYFAHAAVSASNTLLERVSVGGGAIQLIANAVPDQYKAIYYGMAVAPSGRQVVYTVALNNERKQGIGLYVADIYSQHIRMVKGQRDGTPYLRGLALGGTSAIVVYYDKFMLDTQHFRTGTTLFSVLNLNTGAEQPIVPGRVKLSSISPVGGAAISPDGSKLLYTYFAPWPLVHLILRDLRSGSDTELPLSAKMAHTLLPLVVTGIGTSWGRNGNVFIDTTAHSGILFHLNTN